MEIKTKFGVGDKIWLMKDNKCACREVSAIDIQVTQKTTTVWYSWIELDEDGDDRFESLSEDEVFESKEELIKSL